MCTCCSTSEHCGRAIQFGRYLTRLGRAVPARQLPRQPMIHPTLLYSPPNPPSSPPPPSLSSQALSPLWLWWLRPCHRVRPLPHLRREDVAPAVLQVRGVQAAHRRPAGTADGVVWSVWVQSTVLHPQYELTNQGPYSGVSLKLPIADQQAQRTVWVVSTVLHFPCMQLSTCTRNVRGDEADEALRRSCHSKGLNSTRHSTSLPE